MRPRLINKADAAASSNAVGTSSRLQARRPLVGEQVAGCEDLALAVAWAFASGRYTLSCSVLDHFSSRWPIDETTRARAESS